MAIHTEHKVTQVYRNMWKEMWFRWAMILYVILLSAIVLYSGIKTHYHTKTLHKADARIESVSGIDIEANQTDACKRCVNTDVIVRPGIGIDVNENQTQFPSGITTPCYTSNSDGYYLTKPTTLQILGTSTLPKTEIFGNLSFSEPAGFHIPQYTQNCTTNLTPSTCLPFDTDFCDETQSPGSIYIHRRINMGVGTNLTLYSFCACILNIDLPNPIAESTPFCTEPFTPLTI